MNHSNSHLPGIRSERIRSERLETRVLRSGDGAGRPVLFLHGNLSSTTFWEETMFQVQLGERQFPGDWIPSPHWPGFAPGKWGPINAMSPHYNRGFWSD